MSGDQSKQNILLLVVLTALMLVPIRLALGKEGLPSGRPVSGAASYKTYRNQKYMYAVDYPAYLVMQPEPDAHDGRKFISSVSPLKMSAWGCYSTWLTGEEMTIEQECNWQLKHLQGPDLPTPTVTYKALDQTWFVLSGTSGKNIFYQRTVIKHDIFATVLLLYPAGQKSKFDAAVAHIAQSLIIW